MNSFLKKKKMVKVSYIFIFLSELIKKVENLDLSRCEVDIRKWIHYMDEWLENSPYEASSTVIMCMIKEINVIFSENITVLVEIVENKIGFKKFASLLNDNECALNMSDDWRCSLNRAVLVNFLVESFENCYEDN